MGNLTYLPVGERRWRLLAVVPDQCSRRVLAWTRGARRDARLTCRALEAALRRREPAPGLSLHNDRGSEYVATALGRRLQRAGIRQSAAVRGPKDNPRITSFFHSRNAEELHGERSAPERTLRQAIARSVRWYNHRRLPSARGYRHRLTTSDAQRKPASTKPREDPNRLRHLQLNGIALCRQRTKGVRMRTRHRIQFPPEDVRELRQDEVYFYLLEGGSKEKIRLHDYDRLYAVPDLYEQLVYDRLKCQSPKIVVDVLTRSISQSEARLNELRVLDVGAGNGMVGEELKQHGVSRLVGIDIVPEAKAATERDRPGVYDAYYVCNLLELDKDERAEIASWHLDCLVSVAALGFGDMPTRAFVEAFNLLEKEGWIAFNIKETFLDRRDESGFSHLVRELIFSKYMDLYSLQRYRHRFSLEGEPLYYVALAGRKNGDVPSALVNSLE